MVRARCAAEDLVRFSIRDTGRTGFHGEAELPTREIERQRPILIQTAWTLKQNGNNNEVRRLERALEEGR